MRGMTRLLLSVLTASTPSASHAAATARGEPANGLALRIKQISRSGVIVVAVSNVTERPIRSWKESNSWGASRWRVLRISKSHLETFYQNSSRGFMLNSPEVSQIAPGGYVEQTLDLNGRYWCALGRCSEDERRSGDDGVRLETGDTVIAIYDVPFLPETLGKNAWHGVVASMTTVQ
jgi:hypothetical protein